MSDLSPQGGPKRLDQVAVTRRDFMSTRPSLDAVEAVVVSTALEDILFSCFGIDDLRVLALLLAILLGHVGHDFARVGSCPDRILDALRGVGQNPELIISGAAAAKTNGHKQYRAPHGFTCPCTYLRPFATPWLSWPCPTTTSLARHG